MGYYVSGTIEVKATVKVRVSVENYEFCGFQIDKDADIRAVAEEYLNEHAHVTGEPTVNGRVIRAEFNGEDVCEDEMEGDIVCDFTMEVEAEAWTTIEGEFNYTYWEGDAKSSVRRMSVNDWEIDCEWDVEDVVEILNYSMVLEGEGEDEEEIYEEV